MRSECGQGVGRGPPDRCVCVWSTGVQSSVDLLGEMKVHLSKSK